MNKTNNLAEIRKDPKLFLWGEIQGFHEVGETTLVEYQRKDGKTFFSPYVKGEYVPFTLPTLEGALVYAWLFRSLRSEFVSTTNLITQVRRLAMAAFALMDIPEF